MLYKAYSLRLVREVNIPLNVLFKSSVLWGFGSEMSALVTINNRL